MSFWTGTEWAPEPQAPIKRPSRIRHSLELVTEASMIALLVAGVVAGTTLAAKGGKNPSPAGSAAGCVVDGTTVTGSGLPNMTLLNFFVTDSSGKTGWVLGQTDNGSWAVDVPARHGSTTYEFAGRTSGPNGSNYTVYASCTAG